jgi:hypothetical protein
MLETLFSTIFVLLTIGVIVKISYERRLKTVTERSYAVIIRSEGEFSTEVSEMLTDNLDDKYYTKSVMWTPSSVEYETAWLAFHDFAAKSRALMDWAKLWNGSPPEVFEIKTRIIYEQRPNWKNKICETFKEMLNGMTPPKPIKS